ncbi:MAG: hypothetical protein NNA19_00830 [Nitrospira sp.]|nr:hypothetical protein [Nitrospira sp.]MCP9473779.1 hypothetical protein [Nitrospira sp.]
MSWGYWGIVGALVILVSLTLACVMFSTSKGTRRLPPDGETVEGTTIGHVGGGHRQAA